MRLAALAVALCVMAVDTASADPVLGPQRLEAVVFDFPNVAPGTTCTVPYVTGVMNEMVNFLAAESHGRATFTLGSVWGPYTLPQNVDHYAPISFGYPNVSLAPGLPGTPTSLEDASKAIAETLFDYPATDVVVYVYRGSWGASTGGVGPSNPDIGGPAWSKVGCKDFVSGSPSSYMNLHTLQHESVGHAFGLKHSEGLNCSPSDAPQDFHITPGTPGNTTGVPGPGCGTPANNSWDIMDGAGGFEGIAGGVHFTTYEYARLGWNQPSNVQVVDDSTAATLADARLDTPNVNEIRIRLSPTTFYTLEYRHEFGVFVRFVGTSADDVRTGSFPPTVWNGWNSAEELLLNYPNRTNTQHVEINLTDPFFDPYRGIRVMMTSSDATVAHIQIDFNVCAP